VSKRRLEKILYAVRFPGGDDIVVRGVAEDLGGRCLIEPGFAARKPRTLYPLSIRSSARYDPSCPAIPAMMARFPFFIGLRPAVYPSERQDQHAGGDGRGAGPLNRDVPEKSPETIHFHLPGE